MSDVTTSPWFVTYDDGVVCKSVRVNADDSVSVRIEAYNHDALLEQAKIERSASAGKRWEGGKVVGRLPLPLYFSSGMASARLQKDDAWVKRFWSDPDHKYLRTFEGNL
jgi:hypothetical protein